MSNLIIDPNASPIQQPHDKYLDAPMTRREALVLFRKLAFNDNELMGMADTAALVLNFICEKKLGITDRVEIDAYVKLKSAQLQAQREQLKKQQEESKDNQADGVKDAQPNS